jgi:hypothetical protein
MTRPASDCASTDRMYGGSGSPAIPAKPTPAPDLSGEPVAALLPKMRELLGWMHEQRDACGQHAALAVRKEMLTEHIALIQELIRRMEAKLRKG